MTWVPVPGVLTRAIRFTTYPHQDAQELVKTVRGRKGGKILCLGPRVHVLNPDAATSSLLKLPSEPAGLFDTLRVTCLASGSLGICG